MAWTNAKKEMNPETIKCLLVYKFTDTSHLHNHTLHTEIQIMKCLCDNS